MTEARGQGTCAALLAERIAREGPLPFEEFMRVALYEPVCGYYRRDHFGIAGDFYTAAQLQPVYGRLISAAVRPCLEALGPEARVIEMGAGRREMADAFAPYPYLGIDLDSGELPERFTGVVIANEFFDALPVQVAVRQEDGFHIRRVADAEGRFTWITGEPVSGELAEALAEDPPPPEVQVVEVNLEAERWLRKVASCLQRGVVVTIDYGYTRAERSRYPQGTLLSYRRHQATNDVLAQPGEQDITAHVDFSRLQEQGERAGLRTGRLDTLMSFLMRMGERDHFEAALQAPGRAEAERLRGQLKTLLFGMGETFRVCWQEKL